MEDKPRHHFTCVICQESFYGYGNNAQPLKDGRACDECDTLVIQERIRLVQSERQ